jgi:hypothetical protein
MMMVGRRWREFLLSAVGAWVLLGRRQENANPRPRSHRFLAAGASTCTACSPGTYSGSAGVHVTRSKPVSCQRQRLQVGTLRRSEDNEGGRFTAHPHFHDGAGAALQPDAPQ